MDNLVNFVATVTRRVSNRLSPTQSFVHNFGNVNAASLTGIIGVYLYSRGSRILTKCGDPSSTLLISPHTNIRGQINYRFFNSVTNETYMEFTYDRNLTVPISIEGGLCQNKTAVPMYTIVPLSEQIQSAEVLENLSVEITFTAQDDEGRNALVEDTESIYEITFLSRESGSGGDCDICIIE